MVRIKKHINYFGNLSCVKMFSRQSWELSQRVLSSRLRFDNARVELKQFYLDCTCAQDGLMCPRVRRGLSE